MNTSKRVFLIVAFLASVFLCGDRLRAQSFDTELGELATAVAKSLQENQRKKATVLDFMDLQGSVNDLGRFVAEQFSVALVMNRKGFSVMDRANLKTILAEHKLTISGLVEPENAKKLGQFSGVDAIILGNITGLKDEIVVTVKVIATDTAEILGAAKARIPKSKDIEMLFANSSPPLEKTEPVGKSQDNSGASQKSGSSVLDLSKLVEVEKNSTSVGDLFIRVESVRTMRDQGRDCLMATLVMVNTNAEVPLLASIRMGGRYYSTLTDNQGKVFPTPLGKDDIVGIGSGRNDQSYYAEEFTEIEPRRSIKVTIRHEPPFEGAIYGNTAPKIAASPPYRLQFTLAVGNELRNNQLVNGKKRGVLIDVETGK